ncbi:Crp/Fnr family transcriptional regulator [Vibrio paucivorans]
MNDERLDAIYKKDVIKNVRNFSKNSYIFRQGDDISNVYLILEGRVGVRSTTESGKELVFNEYSKGEFLNLVNAFNGEKRSLVDFISIENTKIASIPIQHVYENYSILLLATKQMALTLKRAFEHAMIIYDGDAHTKVSRYISTFKDSKLNLTHDEIAKRLRISRPQVTKALNELESKGYIRTKYKEIEIIMD